MSLKKITGMALGAFCISIAGVAQAEEVNLYSSRQPFLINPLLEAFSDESGIKVNMVYIKKGMLERIKAEGQNSPADLILTSDIGKLDNHVQAGLLKSTTSDVLKEKIPSQYRHPDGLWYGLTTRARIIYAHNKRVKPEEVQTYEDLAKPHMEGRICTRSGKHEYNISLLASIVAAEGEEAALNWAKGVKNNLARKPQGNDRAQVKAVYQGECDVSLGNTYYMGKMVTNEKNPEQKDWAASVFLVFPNQADRGTHVNISGGGVLKGAMNEANAIKLLEFLTGPKAQAIYAKGNFEYPIDETAELHPVVASWGKFKADEVDLTKIAEYRKIATRIMDKVRYNN
ncbi:Iron uptake protein A1 [Candidatus Terasakiella magnetica]|uniref:Iron uptake protein A1 n=1 Tax=Candidatus Terasakiella magnetica TaxID=1867952 RepID=A0A1C3RFS0_9PROT|nr:Fe(3+) ABC transporter substrate-binding protein [Candidatus Terasakiella magnetica]SCA56146.1 Iron uptake protein A1 [Candidatus Terasakiella magnetica]